MARQRKFEFESLLKPIHKTHWKKAHKKLLAKISNLKSSLKKRSEEHDVPFEISQDEIKELFREYYGKDCKYCDKKLTIKTIACDHIVPLIKNGPSTKENLQLICKTCNIRKGPLNEKDFALLIHLVMELPEELSSYVMRKLAKGGRY